MADINSRINKIVGEISGNEALLEMLDGAAAAELLGWGIAMATALAQRTEGMDDAAAEQALEPQLKALRGAMRSTGNWAAGKYADPASRGALRDKLLEHFRVMRGEAALPSADQLDSLLGQVGVLGSDSKTLILNLKQLMDQSD